MGRTVWGTDHTGSPLKKARPTAWSHMMSQTSSAGRYSQIVNRICTDLAVNSDWRFNINSVHRRLHELATEQPEDATLRALAVACAYRMQREGQASAPTRGPFAPMVELFGEYDGQVNPTPLDVVGEDVLDIWCGCAVDESLHPLVRSRLADLLWARRRGTPHPWFRVAVDAYSGLASTEVWIVERCGGLERAIAICKESNHRDLLSGPLDALRELIRRSLATSDGQYGVVAHALQKLADNDHPCSDLLTDAITKYGDNPFRMVDLCKIAIRATQDEDEKRCLRIQQVNAHTDAAGQSSGLPRISHLMDARAITHVAGLVDEERQIAAMIEQTDLADAWQTSEYSVEFDVDELRSYADAVVCGDNLSDALLRFGWSIPINDPEQTRTFLKEMADEFPLSSLSAVIVVGPENSATQIPCGHALRDKVELGQYEAQVINVFASIQGKFALDAIDETYQPDATSLVDCFTCAAVSPHIANRIAVSYEHWKNGDSISAVSVIILTLEPIVRRVCQQVGIKTTEVRVPRTGELPVGEVRTLGPLIKELEAVFGVVPTRYLEAALVDRWSLNLRNSLDHGFIEELTEAQYITLFHIACVLRLMSTALEDRDA